MRKLLEFKCSKCGKHFEELVEEGEQPVCPHCGSSEVVYISPQLTVPKHGKHGSWGVT
jgi:putative FmdB family regulatory protein